MAFVMSASANVHHKTTQCGQRKVTLSSATRLTYPCGSRWAWSWSACWCQETWQLSELMHHSACYWVNQPQGTQGPRRMCLRDWTHTGLWDKRYKCSTANKQTVIPKATQTYLEKHMVMCYFGALQEITQRTNNISASWFQAVFGCMPVAEYDKVFTRTTLHTVREVQFQY